MTLAVVSRAVPAYRESNFPQFDDLIFRLLVRIGITVKMQVVHRHSAFRHHIARNGRIDPAGNEKQALSGSPHGHAARALVKFTEHERGSVFAHVDIHVRLRRMHVYFQRGIFRQQSPADFRVDFHGSTRKFLVGAVGIHFERSRFGRDRFRRRIDAFHFGGYAQPQRIRMYAEYAGKARHDLVRKIFVELRNQIPPARTVQFMADPFQRPFQIHRKYALEIAAVLAL